MKPDSPVALAVLAVGAIIWVAIFLSPWGKSERDPSNPFDPKDKK